MSTATATDLLLPEPEGAENWEDVPQPKLVLPILEARVLPLGAGATGDNLIAAASLLPPDDRHWLWVDLTDEVRLTELGKHRLWQEERKGIGIGPDTRRRSGRIVGGQGSGKTVYVAWQIEADLAEGVGSIVIDPMGTLSSYLLRRLLDWEDHGIWDEVTYVPVGGHTVAGEPWVVPTPFLFNRGDDALQDMTARVVDLWKRLNPEQETAPIYGMPSIERTANHFGMLLAAMGRQLSPDADYLLAEPERWLPEAEAVARDHPVLRSPLATLKLYADPKFPRRDERGETLSFLNKIGPSVLNERLMAQYGATRWTFNLGNVDNGHLILFDCGGLREAERKVAVTWLFACCMEYFRARGYRRDVVNFVVDELRYLVAADNEHLEKDFEELITQLGRNYGVSSFFAYQGITQPSERMQGVLNKVGYSLLGGAADDVDAERLAALCDPYDPFWIKTEEPMLSPYDVRDFDHRGVYTMTRPIVGYRQQLYSPQEQRERQMARHRQTPPGAFYLLMVEDEGGTPRCEFLVSSGPAKASQRFDFGGIPAIKERLVRRRGRKVADVLAEIEARQPPPMAHAPRQPQPRREPPTEPHYDQPAPLPPPTPRRRPPARD